MKKMMVKTKKARSFICKMTNGINVLVRDGILSEQAEARLAAVSQIDEVDTLYLLCKSFIRDGTPIENIRNLTVKLEIGEDDLADFLARIEPYVGERIRTYDPNKPRTGNITSFGCLIPPKQMARLKYINSLSNEEFEDYKRIRMEKFYEEHPELRGE